MKTIYFADIPVGDEHPPVLLPDIDMFFNKDLALAEEVIKNLFSAKVNVIKGAVIHSADIALDDGTLESYFSPETGVVQENYRALMERKVMSLPDHEALFRLCKQLGPELVLSVYDIEGADFSRDIGACALKIPSTNITHEPLIKHLGRLGLPVIIDTGKSTLEEVSRAVQWANDSGVKELIVEHSPEAPPAPISRHNLKMLNSFKQIFDCPVGLSDHHAGNEMMYAAVALGANVIEKGVYADHLKNDQDIYHSMKVSEVAGVWEKCLNIHESLGVGMRYLERDRVKPSARMGLVAKQNLVPGDVISMSTVSFAFPARGIPTEYWGMVEGSEVKGEILQGQVIGWSDID